MSRECVAILWLSLGTSYQEADAEYFPGNQSLYSVNFYQETNVLKFTLDIINLKSHLNFQCIEIITFTMIRLMKQKCLMVRF